MKLGKNTAVAKIVAKTESPNKSTIGNMDEMELYLVCLHQYYWVIRTKYM